MSYLFIRPNDEDRYRDPLHDFQYLDAPKRSSHVPIFKLHMHD